ncbi:hypothetical protein [Variovorax gossypii]|uniref:hypothetical protein n=1 Tax=Variovorax gossypii TaxID=1679495 RepID=UPI001980FAEE|nr:hypothetical protein [Variovorax gossypii]
MTTVTPLISLIDEAAEIAGGLRKLAAALDMNASNLLAMKKGERPCNWRVRGKLRAIVGEDPTRAFIAAMAEDLEASENADEKKAADGFRAMLAAFPENEKSPVNPKINKASSTWRNRRDSNPR